jgi:hypothetical protein
MNDKEREIRIIQENSIPNIEQFRSGEYGSLQALTEFKCILCGENDSWHNSATPTICTECAKKLVNKG